VAGMRPVGVRTPSWDFSANTLDIIAEAGLIYDSSMMADDSCYELVADGRPTGIVELPVEWIRDDAPYFMMERYSSLRPYTPPRAVLQMWCDEFDAAYEDGGLFQLTMHPHIIGHRCRLVVLKELLTYISGKPRVWFATHEAIVRHVRTELE
jgi:peptidoglycan-N-acetylglucosamine deacetylase